MSESKTSPASIIRTTKPKKALGGGAMHHRRTAALCKMSAVVVVAIMVLSVLPSVLPSTSAAESGYIRPIIYIDGEGDNSPVTVNYSGIASAEYNPQYWKGSYGLPKEVGNWTPPKGNVDGLKIKIEFSNTRPNSDFSLTIDPDLSSKIEEIEATSNDGDLEYENAENKYTIKGLEGTRNWFQYTYEFTLNITLNESYSFNKVFAGWKGEKGSYLPGEVIDQTETKLTAEWIIPNIHVTCSLSGTSGEISDLTDTITYNTQSTIAYRDTKNINGAYDEYANIRIIPKGTYSLPSNLSAGTYRSEDPNNPSTVQISGQIICTGDVIIDNLNILNSRNLGNYHGDDTGSGIFANGHTLIMGTGITNTGASSANKFPQVFGGNANGTIDGSTNVIIHSGCYYNVVAGSGGGEITGNTKLIIRGNAAVLDTVIGASSGSGTVSGNTYTYMLGNSYMPGDTYEEKYLDEKYQRTSRIPEGITLEESTILTGGSNNGSVEGNTHVYISNEAELWDVQGAGRRGGSTVADTANVEISGNAWIKHIACGSITDGIYDAVEYSCVKHTNISIRDGAMVASVFGAGYDTYYSAKYASMWGAESTITVTVSGGTVGYVYGGGYRGTIGTIEDPIGSVNVYITGGTILGDVYGGGRGGLDKILHESSGTLSSGSSYNDTTGRSVVYANTVNVMVTGGTVLGDVYGGGESTPVITSYGGTLLDNDTGYRERNNVASVYGNIKVTISGGNIHGSVFGAGKGVDLNDTEEIYNEDGVTYYAHSTAFIMSISKTTDGNATIEKIPWVSGGGSEQHDPNDPTSAPYINYARVNGSNIEISIGSSSNTVDIGGSVFGGGYIGRLGPAYWSETSCAVHIDVIGTRTTIGGDVHGGGYGISGLMSANTYSRDITIDGATVKGSVFGGSRLGNDNCTGKGTVDRTKGLTTIRILSGDIASGDSGSGSGNVYGGSYMGYSYMNVDIRIGSAVEAGKTPSTNILKIESIYGGASVGTSSTSDSGSLNNEKLLIGDVTISIGGSSAEYGSALSITGDVFGEGDYCAIDGNASITFDGFNQGDTRIRSIQKADTLTVRDSTIAIRGSADGSVTTGSAMYALCNIGMLTIKSTDVSKPGSCIEMDSQVSSLGGYVSIHYDGGSPTSTVDTDHLNTIRMNRGMILSILGQGNDGNGVEEISGKTRFIGDINEYYGAFAIGAMDAVIDGTEFILENGNPAGHTDYRYDGEGKKTLRAWHISGTYIVEETVLLTSGSNVWNGSVGVPKLSSSSTVVFSGYYVTSGTQGGMNIEDLTGASTPGYDYDAVIGTENGDLRFDKSIELSGWDGTTKSSTTNGLTLGISIETPKDFTRTGYVGKITLHMAEMNGNLVIGTFDVILSIFLRMDQSASDTVDIGATIVVTETGDSETGSVDVYLPNLPNNVVGLYTYQGSSNIPSESVLTMTTASTGINKPGWITGFGSSFDLPMNVGDTIGTAGGYSPVLRFDITGTDLTSGGGGRSMTVTIRVVPESGSTLPNGKDYQDYCITFEFIKADNKTVTFYDRYLTKVNDEITWSGYLELLKMQVPFGGTLSDQWIAVKNDFMNSASSGNISESDYISEFATNQLYPNGEIALTGTLDTLTSEMDLIGKIVSSYQWEIDGITYTIVPINELLDHYVLLKPDSNDVEGFEYHHTYGWYDTDLNYSRYNFYSEVTADELSIYAGYRITLTIEACYFDKDGNEIEANVNPPVLFVNDPNEIILLSDLESSVEMPRGYEVDHWEAGEGIKIEDTKITIAGNSTIKLILKQKEYKVTINVVDKNGDMLTNEITANIKKDGYGAFIATYLDEVSVNITLNADERIDRVSGLLGSGSTFQSFTVSGSTVSFTMTDDDMTVTVTLRTDYTVTFELPSDLGDNLGFGFKGTIADGTVNIIKGGTVRTVSGNFESDKTFSIDITGVDGRTFTLYANGSLEGSEITSFGYETYIKDGNVTVILKILTDWKLTYPEDCGYTVKRGDDSLDISSIVHTGDQLRLEASDGYLFDSSFSYSGVVKSSESSSTTMVFTVNGSSDVIFGHNTKLELKVTVYVHFKDNVDQDMELSYGPTGNPDPYLLKIGVDIPDEDGWNRRTIDVHVDNGKMYDFMAICDGYTSTTVTESFTTEGGSVNLYIYPNPVDETPEPRTWTVYAMTGASEGVCTDPIEDGLEFSSHDGVVSVRFTVTSEGYAIAIEGIGNVVGTMMLTDEWGNTVHLIVVPVPVSHSGLTMIQTI